MNKFSWLGNLNYVVSFQFPVIGKDCLHRRITEGKSMQGREFYAIPWCIWFLSLKHVLEISCHLYDFIKCFNVSLHLSLLCWNVTLRLERILVWRFMVLCCGNGSWCGCIARRIWNNHRWYSENWLWKVFMWCYMHYPLIYCLCGTVGPWVKVPKALEQDTPKWVYGVGPTLGYESQKTWGMTFPWVWVPKGIGYDLPLGVVPK